jgi:hypothetical protein
MNILLILILKFFIVILTITLIYLLIEFINYKNLTFPKWLKSLFSFLYIFLKKVIKFVLFINVIIISFINKLKFAYKRYSFRCFVKSQYLKLSNKRNTKEFYRNFNLMFHRLYLYLNHVDAQFEDDSLIGDISNDNYIYNIIYNIYNVQHKDLFRATYLHLMSNPKISKSLDGRTISLVGISFTDPETKIN